jgi:hypothetical protein
MAKRPQPPKSKRTEKPQKTRTPYSGEAPAPIFSGSVSNVVPGELLVQLQESTAAQVSSSIARGPTRGILEAHAATFGVDPLDAELRKLRVTAITRLHPPAPVESAALAVAVPMAATFRVRYESGADAETAASTLEALDGVEFAEPNRYRETSIVPNDPSFPSQWGLTRINCPAAWDRTTGSANVTVAVIDTGIDLDHPELAPLIVPGRDFVDLGPNPTPPPGFRFEGDFMGVDNDPQDEVGHGTHVAGTIACLSNNNSGVAGVTWNCRLMPVRVLARIVNINNPNDVRGTGSAADIAAGIRWAVDHGARVLNLSLGGTVDTQVERDAIAYAIAHGVVVVAAMGNGFLQGNATSFPAAYPDVIAVGAIDQSDHRANFSQTGPHIDVAAPGVGVLSTVWNNGFATFQGTSMASPHVAGVAALIISCNPQLTAAQVGDIIRQTARPLRDNPADPIPNDAYGFGCVDAQAALVRACPPRPSRPIFSCPSTVTICPSTAIRCPTPSRPVFTCPSVITICPTQSATQCPPPSRPIISCPSVITICPTQSATQCPPSRPIFSCPSVVTICPSQGTICPSVPAATCPFPSRNIRCPSGPLCGFEPPVGGEGQGDWPTEDWEDYDPYSNW